MASGGNGPGASAPAGAEERLAALLASVVDAIVTVDDRGAIESVNPAAERLFSYSSEDLVGRSFLGLLAEPYRGEYRAIFTAFARDECSDILGVPREVLGRGGDGASFPLELSLTPMPLGTDRLLVAVARDLSDRKRVEKRLRNLIDHDPLTGLLNRGGFERAVARHIDCAARYGGAGSVLVLDVDNFKYVNDSIGHRAGDELLRTIAGLIAGRLRRTDVVARIGGDEFAVLLHGTDLVKARAVAEELREIVGRHPFVLDRQRGRVTLSAGVAALEGQVEAGPDLVNQADVAMYEAKEQGRDRVAEFTIEEQAAIAAQWAWSERIRDATERGLFVLLFQPILNLAANRVSQYELLLRMRGEDGGLVVPGAFLGTAERFGLIQAIDRWVAQQAIRLLAARRKHGHSLVVEVNLSAKTMSDPDFTTLVERDLIRTGVDPAQLVFEVTETAAVADLDQARRFAQSLVRIGCRFALDDFGAGFASFYYLKHLPISYLKIDGEFVRELARTRIDQLLVQSLVQVSKGLGIKTIAEFVGDEETVELLRGFGVDYAQGYHIGRPTPVSELSRRGIR